jgi:hypothetical protein
LGVQSAGVWPDRLLLPEVEPEDDEPGLVVLLLPWFCSDWLLLLPLLLRSLG